MRMGYFPKTSPIYKTAEDIKMLDFPYQIILEVKNDGWYCFEETSQFVEWFKEWEHTLKIRE